jgi:hypothetical protein
MSKLYDPTSLPSFTCDTNPVFGFHQRILRNMGLVRTVLIWGLEIDFDLMTKIGPNFGDLGKSEVDHLFKQSHDMLYAICKRVIFTLNAFVEQNPVNQSILFDYLTLLRAKMGVGLNVWDVVITGTLGLGLGSTSNNSRISK